MPEWLRRAVPWATTVVLLTVVVVSVVTARPPTEDRALAIGSRLRCPVCSGETVADSNSQYARDIMSLIRQRVNDGWSDQQVIDEILQAFPQSQLLSPGLSTATAALWLTPALALAIGVAMAAGRRRVPQPPAQPAEATREEGS